MLIIFWNIQRPGESGLAANRLDLVFTYLNTLANTFQPDLICLCEVSQGLIDTLDLRLRQNKLYGGVGYVHQLQARQEAAEDVGLSSRPAPAAYTEAACSFYVIHRRARFPMVRVFTHDSGRFYYDDRGHVRTPEGRQVEVAVRREARPLVLIQAGPNQVYGLCHLISGSPARAAQQLTAYLQTLAAFHGAWLIGDMNIALPELGARGVPMNVYRPHDPGYATYPDHVRTLDYLWTNGLWNDVDAAAPAAGLIRHFFQGEGRLSDHVPVAYRLDNAMFRRAVPAMNDLPIPPRTVSTRRSSAVPQAEPLWKLAASGSAPAAAAAAAPASSSGGKQLMQKSMLSFLSKAPGYAVNAHQAAALATANLQEVPVPGDGDCLFASLVAMGVRAHDGTAFAGVQALRDRVADHIRTNAVLRQRLRLASYQPLTLADQIATPGFWFGAAGDIMPELLCLALGIRLSIINSVGQPTNIGAAGTRYVLIRFNPQGGEHYHGTRPRA